MRCTRYRVSQFGLLTLTMLTCLLAAEMALRHLSPDQVGVLQDQYRLGYRYDAELGWFPSADQTRTFAASRVTTVRHNARGFRDGEHVVDSRPGLLVLGDSFVWGYDVEKTERFTDRLAAELTAWQVFNLGVSGYGTDQEYLLLQREFDYYNPKIVLITFCTDNDRQDNSTSARYGGFQKPYYSAAGETLTLHGVPVPPSSRWLFMNHPSLYRFRLLRLAVQSYARFADPAKVRVADPTELILLAMQRFVAARGCVIVVGLQDREPQLEQFLRDRAIPSVDLSNLEKYPGHGQHWTPAGHAVASERILAFLKVGGYLLPDGLP